MSVKAGGDPLDVGAVGGIIRFIRPRWLPVQFRQ